MNKLIAKVVLLANGSVYPKKYCIDNDGAEIEAISLTLGDAVWELHGPPLAELENLRCNSQPRKIYEPIAPGYVHQ